MVDLPRIGWRERVSLPGLDIARVTAKVDTGARTSSLHAFAVEVFTQAGGPWVRFGVHPSRRDSDNAVWCTAEVVDQRGVRNSGGQETVRYFIATHIQLDGQAWDIEISLAPRDNMGYRMLLGRTAVQGRFLVDPEKSYLLSHRSPSQARTRA